MIDELPNLFAAFSGIQRFSAALYQISNAVRFRAPTTLPKRVQREPSSVSASREHRFRHHRKSTANTGEAAVLRKAAQLNRAVERTRYLENRMRNFRIGDIRLVRGVEEQKRIVFACVINPARELGARRHGASWIVWKTKINEIDMLLRWLRNEIVFRRAGQIINALVAAILSRRTGVARHHVRVHVHRINWVWHRDFVLAAEDIEDVTAIVF